MQDESLLIRNTASADEFLQRDQYYKGETAIWSW